MSKLNIFNITKVSQLKSLKVACILDEFSYENFASECILQQLTPDGWEAELKALSPDMLLVESAWRGKDDLWQRALLSQSLLFVSIINWCNDRRIPTVFWNKEDPVNFENFTYGMGISQLFDHVFTTDIDSISSYKKILDHNRVYLLPFTFQPSLHNPIEQYDREDAICFAGSYYHKYPKRSRDFRTIYNAIIQSKPVVIYDRNHSRGDPKFQYPEEYHQSIKGFLPFSEISKGYKGYEYGLTMNSVTQSQTMFARRALELIACNTSIISNYSRSLRLFFGDGVTMLGDESCFEQELAKLFSNESERKRVKYHLLRHVFKEFTAQRGMQVFVECVTGKRLHADQEEICCIAKITSKEAFDRVVENFSRQSYSEKKLVVIADGDISDKLKLPQDAICYSLDLWDEATAASLLEQFAYVAKFDERDYYGTHYLADSMMAQAFAPGAITCRNVYYSCFNQCVSLNGEATAYQWCREFVASSAVFPSKRLAPNELRALLVHEFFEAGVQEALSLDIFNYCRFGADEKADLSVVDPGEYRQLITLEALQEMASAITSECIELFSDVKVSGSAVLETFSQQREELIVDMSSLPPIRIISNLKPDNHTYINSDILYDIEMFRMDNHLQFRLDCGHDFEMMLEICYFDAQAVQIARVLSATNLTIRHPIREGAAFVKFALRIKGPGTAEIFDLFTGNRMVIPAAIKNLSDHLYIASKNDFPNASQLNNTDIFIYSDDLDFDYLKVGNCDAIIGGEWLLGSLLKGSIYKTVRFSDSKLEDFVMRSSSQKVIFSAGAS